MVRRRKSVEERYPLVEYMPEVHEAAKRELPKLREGRWHRSCRYSWVMQDGRASETVAYHCFGGLQRSERNDQDVALFCTYRTNEPVRLGAALNASERQIGLDYLTWLLNESVFANVFVTKDAVEAHKDGIICHTHYPAAFMLSACAYARYTKELPGIVRFWASLRNVIDPHAALVFAHFFREYKDKQYYIEPSVSVINTVFDPNQMGKQELTRMVNKDLRCLQGRPFSEQQGPYKEFTHIWRSSGNLKHSNLIKDGPLLEFVGGEIITHTDSWSNETWTRTYFKKDNIENDARQFFADNYAGKDYA